MKTRLPTGIQTFRTLRDGGYRYVDKTPWVRRMVEEGSYYFLSRPRSFGKSLFLDTLRELFAGSEEPFEGLHIHPHWDWATRHPSCGWTSPAAASLSRASCSRRRWLSWTTWRTMRR